MSSREEFEAHPKFKGMDFTRSEKHPEYYESPYANVAWEGWQASRQQVIELPSWHGANDERLFMAHDVLKAINAAGFKAKL